MEGEASASTGDNTTNARSAEEQAYACTVSAEVGTTIVSLACSLLLKPDLLMLTALARE